VKKRIEPFASRIGLDFISAGAKPLPFGYLRGAKRLSVKNKNIAIVGDQIFTDVLGGNIVGMKTILLTPIKLEDSYGFRFKRWLERFVYKIHNIKDENE
jgi:HAD superfamily phosphatase (TIGR01668 family)